MMGDVVALGAFPSDESGWPSDWPLVGRGEELESIRQARRAKPPRAVVLGGGQGVGRSRVAAEALAEAQAERWAVDRVDGAAATAAVPFGAVAHLAPPEAARSGDPLRLLLSITDQLTQRAARRPLMLLVDDGHDLDSASLALLRRLAATPNLFLLVTVRSDASVPTPIVGLWKDGDAHRIELGALNRDETYRLVADALGGDVETATLRWLWNHSLGNPLFLRELVLAEPGVGWRRSDDGMWTCSPRERLVGRRLAEVVRSRLGELDDEQRAVLETLTISGPLPLDQLSALVPLPAVTAVAARGLAVARPDGVVSLAHPLYGIMLQDAFTPLRARALRRQLLDLLESTGDPRPGDVVRMAALRLEEGGDVDTHQLVLAAHLVVAAYPLALAERLGDGPVRMSEAGAAVALAEASAHPSRDDLTLVGRLTRRAWETDRSLAAGLAWAAFLVATGQAAEADTLTTELESLVVSEWDRTWVALTRASLQLWVLGRAEESARILVEAEATVADPDAVRRLRRERAGVALNVGRVGEAVEIAVSLLDAAGPDEPVAAMAASTAAAGLALAGRLTEAVDLVDRFLLPASMQVTEAPEVLGQLMLARLYASRQLGALDEADWVGEACHQAAIDQGSLDAMGIFGAALGQVTLDRGRPATAVRRLREGEVLLRERDMFGYRPWVLANLAMALAQLGQPEAAEDALGQARAAATQARYFDSDLTLAHAWCCAAAGRLDDAVAAAATAADIAQRVGVHGFEATALHALVRLGRPSAAGERLAELAASANSPLWSAFAAHAEAAATANPYGLAEASTTFEKLGAGLLAAEAAFAAAALAEGGDAFRAAARAQALAGRCEGARTPGLRVALRAPELTLREQQVATLAAEGFTSKAIAERLVVSPRTVESHLYRVFTKLGVTDRAQLADLFFAK